MAAHLRDDVMGRAEAMDALDHGKLLYQSTSEFKAVVSMLFLLRSKAMNFQMLIKEILFKNIVHSPVS